MFMEVFSLIPGTLRGYLSHCYIGGVVQNYNLKTISEKILPSLKYICLSGY